MPTVLASLVPPGGLPGQPSRSLQLHLRVCQHPLDGLPRREECAERRPAPGVSDAHLQGCLGYADAGGGDPDTTDGQPTLGQREALSRLSEEILTRHFDLVEEDLAGVSIADDVEALDGHPG